MTLELDMGDIRNRIYIPILGLGIEEIQKKLIKYKSHDVKMQELLVKSTKHWRRNRMRFTGEMSLAIFNATIKYKIDQIIILISWAPADRPRFKLNHLALNFS